MSIEPSPDPAPFAHKAVRLSVPAGTDLRAAISEAMSVFMERTDGTSALPWWVTTKMWHGGHESAAVRRSRLLLPPSQTGVLPGLDNSDRDAVYLTTSRDDALMYATRHNRPVLYEVALTSEPTFDDMMPDNRTSWRVPSARISRIEYPSKYELMTAVVRVLGQPEPELPPEQPPSEPPTS